MEIRRATRIYPQITQIYRNLSLARKGGWIDVAASLF
jgi:hypothetical protein